MAAAPTRQGYDFVGWKLQDDITNKVYQPGETFIVSDENWDLSKEMTPDTTEINITDPFPSWREYHFIPQWKKSAHKYTIQHYLPDENGNYSDTPSFEKICETPEEATKVFIIPIKGDTNPQFIGYEVNNDRNENEIKKDDEHPDQKNVWFAATSEENPFTGVLKLYYKHTTNNTAKIKISKKVLGSLASSNREYKFVLKATPKQTDEETDKKYNEVTTEFSLKDGEEIVIEKLPNGGECSIKEEKSEDFYVSYVDKDGNKISTSKEVNITLESGEDIKEIKCINTTKPPATGITATTNSWLPMIGIIFTIGLFTVLFPWSKKRKEN